MGQMRGLVALMLVAGCGQVADPPPDVGQRDLLEGFRGGCVLALHMDEASFSGAAGEVIDDCGGDNPGSIDGSVVAMPGAGVRGGALSFPGNGCITIPDATQLHGVTGLTLSAWINPSALKNGNNADGLISKRTGTNMDAEYSLSVWTQYHVWTSFNGDNDNESRFQGNVTVTVNNWIQITSVYDATQPQAQRAKIYVNGAIDSVGTTVTSALKAYPSVLHIGCMPSSPTNPQYFAGLMDEVVIWNRALSETELKAWYNATKP